MGQSGKEGPFSDWAPLHTYAFKGVPPTSRPSRSGERTWGPNNDEFLRVSSRANPAKRLKDEVIGSTRVGRDAHQFLWRRNEGHLSRT